jgi:hypothetical protein
MQTAPAAVDWSRAQEALRREVGRVTALMRSVRNPSAPSVGHWSLAEVAMHLSQAWLVVPCMSQADLSGVWEWFPGLEGGAGESLVRTLGDLADATSLGVDTDSERDLAVIADRIEERAAAYFDACGRAAGEDELPWLVQGSRLSRVAMTCHLLNETVMHAYDIARADGQRWEIDPDSARIVLEGFILDVMRALDPRALVDQERAGSVRAAFELRMRGGGRHVFVFDRGEVRVESPGSRRVDCTISAEPAAMLLVVWARKDQWWAIARGKLTTWGRKPWMALRFRGMLRNP